MPIKEHWGIENAPLWHYLMFITEKNAFPVIIVNNCSRDSWEHALNYSQYIVSDTSKHFKFD